MQQLFFRVVVLSGVIAGTTAASLQGSARDVLERFCELDAGGKQTTTEGWKEIASLFTEPGSPQRESIIVIRDFVVSHPLVEGNKREFYVEYISLGQIDPSTLRFSALTSGPSGPVKVRSAFILVPGSSPARHHSAAEWQIKGSPPEPHLTIAAAAHYVMDRNAKTTDPQIRRNAAKTLAQLERVQ